MDCPVNGRGINGINVRIFAMHAKIVDKMVKNMSFVIYLLADYSNSATLFFSVHSFLNGKS